MAYSRPGVYLSERLLSAPINTGATADAAGAVVAPFAQGPETVTFVSSWYQFVNTFGGYNALYPATFQVGAFFANGGRELYVKRLLASDAEKSSVDILTSSSAVVASVFAKNAGTDGDNLRVKITAGSIEDTWTLSVYKEAGVANESTDDILLERYENIVFDDANSTSFAETVVNLVSSNITISDSGSGTPVATVYPLSGGDDGTTPVAADYLDYKGTEVAVFEDFSTVNRPLVFFLPAVHSLASDIPAVIDAATSWAEGNEGFVVIDTAPDKTVAQAISFAGSLTDSSHGAVYYPNLLISDPIGRSSTALRKIGPSGSIVGLYLDTDAKTGVFKAPAGIGMSVRGVVAVERGFSSTDLDNMNASTSPINPIRQVPGAGLVVMGARTLLQDGTANKYVNMRRSLIYIKKTLKNITEFAIFENNDERLWAQISTVISVFLNQYRNQGGLRGATPSQAFFVKCDGENNTAVQIQNGEVHIQVGVALQYPAEFIVIDLSQKSIN
jgi:hypothetical protein